MNKPITHLERIGKHENSQNFFKIYEHPKPLEPHIGRSEAKVAQVGDPAAAAATIHKIEEVAQFTPPYKFCRFAR